MANKYDFRTTKDYFRTTKHDFISAAAPDDNGCRTKFTDKSLHLRQKGKQKNLKLISRSCNNLICDRFTRELPTLILF